MEQLIQTPTFFWISWVAITLFGIAIGWWLRTATLGGRRSAEQELREQERLHLATVNAQLREAHDLKEADLKKALLELDEHRTRSLALEQAQQQHIADSDSMAAQMQALENQARAHVAQIQTYEEQILGLRARNAQLAEDPDRLREEIKAWKTLHLDFAAMQKNNAALEETVAQLEQERDLAQQALDAAQLEIENLQLEIVALRPAAAPDDELPTESHARLAAAPAEDLKIINGIAPFSEQKLHALGVSSIEQIADWDSETVAEMNDTLGFMPGRIEKEDWVGQARHLAGRRAAA